MLDCALDFGSSKHGIDLGICQQNEFYCPFWILKTIWNVALSDSLNNLKEYFGTAQNLSSCSSTLIVILPRGTDEWLGLRAHFYFYTF